MEKVQMDGGAATAQAARKRRPLGKIALIIVGVVLLIFLGRQAGAYVPPFTAWVETLGVWGPIVFIAGYAIAAVAFIPGSVLTLAAGAIFGLLNGIPVRLYCRYPGLVPRVSCFASSCPEGYRTEAGR